MSRILIIGYGSTLRGDDAAGRCAADRLAEAFADDPSLEVLSVPQLTPEVVLPVAEAGRVYFIDATGSGTPGAWACQPLAPEAKLSNPLGHHYHPAALLAFAHALYKSAPRAWLLTVSAESFACGETLTPKVETAVGEIVAHLQKKVAADASQENPDSKRKPTQAAREKPPTGSATPRSAPGIALRF